MDIMKFYECKECGNFVGMIKSSGAPMICCGQPMTEVIPGTSDGAHEKHVPVIEVEGNVVTVKVGEVEHPMADVHYIEWIAIETEKGAQRKVLNPGDAPVAVFALTEDDKLIAAYEHCNLHGLWKADE